MQLAPGAGLRHLARHHHPHPRPPGSLHLAAQRDNCNAEGKHRGPKVAAAPRADGGEAETHGGQTGTRWRDEAIKSLETDPTQHHHSFQLKSAILLHR